MTRSALLLLACAACTGDTGAADAEPQRVAATIATSDTTHWVLALPAGARRCADGRAVALEAASERGDGLLILLRSPEDVAPGVYAVIVAGDTSAPRGAEVGVRYMVQDVAHGFTLDSGAVQVTAAGSAFTGTVNGRGLEGSVRVGVEATFAAVPLSSDTVSCRREP